MERRRFVTTTASATAIALAGCLGGSDDPHDSPDGVVEAYYEAEDEEEQEDLIHTVSIAQDGGAVTVTQVWAADSVDAEVVEEDLSEEEVASYLGLFPEEDIATIAEGENALVEGTVDPPDFGGEESEEFDVTVLTAEEDGNWKFVMQVG